MPTELVVAAVAACAPPAVMTPPPAPAALERLASRTEEIVIARPLAVVQRADAVPLEQAVQGSGDLPHVVGTRNLTPDFERPGSRRVVCLSDGSTLLERVLVREQTANATRFRYQVWNYTSPSARAVHYAIGEFRHTQRPDGSTHVRWTYAFQLRRDRFPGRLGSLGSWLFRTSFLDRDYAAMMRSVLEGTKGRAEALPHG